RAQRQSVASALLVPLPWNGEVQRVLVASWHERRDITPATVEPAELIADVAAAGLARLEADARRAAGSMQDHAVVRAARALNASLDLQEVLQTLVDEAGRALGAETSGIYLGDAERGAIATAGHNVPESRHG